MPPLLNGVRVAFTIMISGSVFFAFLGCSAGKQGAVVREILSNSLLESHLMSADRDPIYCAASYVASKGGPDLPSPMPDSMDTWHVHAERLLQWLRQADPSAAQNIVDGFPRYVERWSPVFPPEGENKLGPKGVRMNYDINHPGTFSCSWYTRMWMTSTCE